MIADQALAEAVKRHIDAHRDDLAALVQRELDRVVGEMVSERLANDNGNGATLAPQREQAPADTTPGPTPTPELPQPAAKLCRVCGEAGAFSEGRRVCKRCRIRQQRERDAARRTTSNGAGDEPPG